MKKLCFGSYIKVLTLCKSAVGKSQKNICGTVILSLKPVNYDIRTDDAKTSDLTLCRAVLPPDVVDLANQVDAQTDKSALVEFFRTKVICLIDDNKKSDVVLALKDIIANDMNILPDTVVDKVSGLSKSALVATNLHVFENFLAGIFLYVVTIVINTEGKKTASTINENYMTQFASRASEVHFTDKTDRTTQSANTKGGEQFSSDGESEVVDGVRIENDFQPNFQQNIYNQTIDVKGNNNLVNGFVFNLHDKG